MSARSRLTGKRLLVVATFVIAIAILWVLFTHIDIPATFAQLKRVGLFGALVVLLDMTVALLGPVLAWHMLLRADGIAINLRTTIASSLMGHAVNFISPLMYFGGEGVRTLHVARVTDTPRPRVLATVVANAFQQLTSFCASIVAALIVITGGSYPTGMPLLWITMAALSLVAIVALIFGALLFDLRLIARTIGLAIRLGIFPKRLASVRDDAADMEQVVRSLLVQHKPAFLRSQLLVLLSPIAQFVQPAIFFWLLGAPLPSLTQLASFYVLIQLLLILPVTPAGLGVYEGGIIGIFRLHGWSIPEGAAYAILMRLDDIVFTVTGVVLLTRLGLTSFLSEEKPSHA